METFNSELGTISEVKNRMIETRWKLGSNLFFHGPQKTTTYDFSRSESFATSRFGRSDLEHLW